MKKLLFCLMLLLSSLCLGDEYYGGDMVSHNNHYHNVTETNSMKEADEIFENKVYYFNKYYKNVAYNEFIENGIKCRVALFEGKNNPDICHFVIQYGLLVTYGSRIPKNDCEIFSVL